MLTFVPSLADHSTRFHTCYEGERPVATVQRPRVYDRTAPAFKVFALDGSHLGDAEAGFSARRIIRGHLAAQPGRKHHIGHTTRADDAGGATECDDARALDCAASLFVYHAQRLIEAFAMRDTRAGWAVFNRARAIARDIEAGNVTAASLDAFGGRVTFIAGRA